MPYTSPELQWSAEKLSGDKGIVSGRGRRGINLSYDRLDWSGGVLYWWQRTMAEAEAKMEVGANYEGLKRREDKNDNIKLTDTTPIHAHASKTKTRENTVHPLALYVLCWVFVRVSFLQNPKPENTGKLFRKAPHRYK